MKSGRPMGSKHTPEAIEKISQANAERWRDPAYRARHLERFLAMQAKGAQARRLAGLKRQPLRASTRARPFTSIADRLEMYSIPEPNSGCLLWLGGMSSDGYGKMDVHERGLVGVHRLALEQKLGRALLPGEFACHKCDVKLCIAEDHLFPGTHDDNMADMRAKGRQYKGPRRKGKLTREQIGVIPHELGSDRVVAIRYGVSPSRVQAIRSAARSVA